MSSHNSRRKYTPAQKVIIIKKHLLENIPVSKICAEYGINPNLFYKWQKEFFDNGQRAFEKENRATVAKYEKEISILKDKLKKKNEVLSELMEEHISLKKSLGEI